MPNGARQVASRRTEDALVYLPHKSVVEYRRGQVIYDESQPSNGIYLVVRGRVKTSVPMDDGSQTVIEIFAAEDFFGESGLLELPQRGESAVALENTSLMAWSTAEIEEQVDRQPKLGLAFIQTLVERCLDFEERLQSFALDKTPERIMRALLRFANRFGTRAEDGSVRIPPMTHQLISEYVGTSREIVTFQMNRLRQEGFIRYSRKGIDVYTEPLAENLRRITEPGLWRATGGNEPGAGAFSGGII
ncbi:MAG TPA: Crp/Fnr family transcriptional regulator [Bryobacteraceae bacterium]|nr:Crp/Fnr family transcriptional regulator [Bryobacteraceae bacterium]